MKVPRDAIQDFLYWFDPNAPTEDQILSVLISMAKDTHDIKQILSDLTVSLGGNISSATSSINSISNINISALLTLNFPPWIYPTKNSVYFYERDSENVLGIINSTATSSLIVEVTVPKGYEGHLFQLATDDNTSSYHQFVIDGVPENQLSGTAAPQATLPMLQFPIPLIFKQSFKYYATNFNNTTATYQGILAGWFAPLQEDL
jgi:hypothetical protein